MALVLHDDPMMARLRSRVSDKRLRAYLHDSCIAFLFPGAVTFVFPERFRLHFEKVQGVKEELSSELRTQVGVRLWRDSLR